MSVRLSVPVVEAGELAVGQRVEHRPLRWSLATEKAAWLRAAGQAVLASAAAGLFFGDFSSGPKGLAVIVLASAIWFVSVEGALSTYRLAPVAIGRTPRLLTGTITGFLIFCTATAWVPWLRVDPGRACLLAVSILLLSSAWHEFVDRVFVRSSRVLVVGAGRAAYDLVERLAAAGGRRFEIVGILQKELQTDEIAGIQAYGSPASLTDVVNSVRPDVVVIGPGQERSEIFRRLLEAGSSTFAVSGLAEFYEHAFGYVPVRHMTHAWFMSVFHLYQPARPRFVKRAFDLVIASAALLLTAPLLLLVALTVRISGPVIYRQTRLGEGGRFFTMYKFRTMRVGAECPGEARWAEKNDSRSTRFGRVLRRTRLDELPQLGNVLRGDMSIVGPRPERPEFLELLVDTVPFWAQRHLLRPGMTGWAQVRNGYAADVTDAERKLSYDLWYLRHQSLLVDLLICARTFATIVRGTGAR
jgi:exopolysaccharide biosynthesis polyprenyl glycosylphosphotransferase